MFQMQKMQALRFIREINRLEIMTIHVPKVSNPDDVLVKVLFSGVCESDLHFIQGQYPNKKNCITLGHEFCGVVADIGPNVKLLKVGDKVAVDPNSSCGCCQHCLAHAPYLCSISGTKTALGISKDGGWADYVLVTIGQIHRIPDSISLETAVLAEPLSCVIHSWNIVSPISLDGKVLIIGAGIIGYLWIVLLRLHGNSNVTVCETSPTRLGILKKFDFGYHLLKPEELIQKKKSNPNIRFDFIIDCSGSSRASKETFSLLQEGGKLCCLGEASPQAEIRIKIYENAMKKIKMYGTLTNPFTFTEAVSLLDLIGERYLNYEMLGIRMFPLREYADAIEMLKTGVIPKAVFKF